MCMVEATVLIAWKNKKPNQHIAQIGNCQGQSTLSVIEEVSG